MVVGCCLMMIHTHFHLRLVAQIIIMLKTVTVLFCVKGMSLIKLYIYTQCTVYEFLRFISFACFCVIIISYWSWSFNPAWKSYLAGELASMIIKSSITRLRFWALHLTCIDNLETATVFFLLVGISICIIHEVIVHDLLEYIILNLNVLCFMNFQFWQMYTIL